MRRTLGTGDDVFGCGGETHRAQMLGDLVGTAGGVVGDVQRAGGDGRQGVDGAGRGFVAAEYGAVEIEKQAIVFLHKGGHVSRAP